MTLLELLRQWGSHLHRLHGGDDGDGCNPSHKYLVHRLGIWYIPRERRRLGHRSLIQIKRDVRSSLQGLSSHESAQVPVSTRATHLDPIDDLHHILSLKQELLSLAPHTNHVPLLVIIAPKSTLGLLERIMPY